MRRPDGKIQRCQAKVLKRDTYRRDGRGAGGFSMHYDEDQCTFSAKETVTVYDKPFHLCSRHAKLFERKGQYWVTRYSSDHEMETAEEKAERRKFGV